MGGLIAGLVPVALGVVLSPLAIMALVAVLLSRRARTNGVAYLLGWAVAIVAMLLIFTAVFNSLKVNAHRSPAAWVIGLHLVLALVFFGGAVWIYRRGAAQTRKMAAASSPGEVARAATLPGWLQSVSTFTPVRTFLLGIGLFVLNPVDASCAIVAALDIALADVTTAQAWVVGAGFFVIGILPIAVPVIWLLVAGERAQPTLDKVRSWIVGNTHVLNAALLVIIGVLQLQKFISGLS